MVQLSGLPVTFFILFLLYQLTEYHSHMTRITGNTRLQEAAAGSWYCDPSEQPRVHGTTISVDRMVFNDGTTTTCHDAARLSKQNTYLMAFKALVEHSYLYKALTLESYMSQLVALMILMFLIYSVTSYFKEVYKVNSFAALNATYRGEMARIAGPDDYVDPAYHPQRIRRGTRLAPKHRPTFHVVEEVVYDEPQDGGNPRGGHGYGSKAMYIEGHRDDDVLRGSRTRLIGSVTEEEPQ